MDISIDNSAASIVLSDKEMLGDLVKRLKSDAARLIFPCGTIEELLSGGDLTRVRERTIALIRLIESPGVTILISAHHTHAFASEICTQQFATPQMSWSDFRGLVRRLDEFNFMDAPDLTELSRAVRKAKEDMLRNSVEFYGTMQKTLSGEDGGITGKDIVKIVENYGGPSRIAERSVTGKWMVGHALKAIGVEDKTIEDAIFENRCRFPIVWTHLMLSEFNILCTLIPQNDISDAGSMLRIQEGDWYDAKIACMAAYCKYFLVNDKRLKRRCDFLRKRNLVDFEPITLCDYIKHRS